MSKVLEAAKTHGIDHIALWIGEQCDKNLLVKGHWLYVRKCKHGDFADDDGLIVRPEKSKQQCLWCEILGKGIMVGEPRDFRVQWRRTDQLASKKPPKQSADDFAVGDLVMVPEAHPWGIIHSPYAADEFFIDESVPLCRMERPDEH